MASSRRRALRARADGGCTRTPAHALPPAGRRTGGPGWEAGGDAGGVIAEWNLPCRIWVGEVVGSLCLSSPKKPLISELSFLGVPDNIYR
jgi:hypothetical protein